MMPMYFFLRRVKCISELNESDAEPMDRIMILMEPQREKANLEAGHLRQGVPTELWGLSSTDMGRSSQPLLSK